MVRDVSEDSVREYLLAFGPSAAFDGGGEHALDLGQGEANQARDNLTTGTALLATLLLTVLGYHGWRVRRASTA